MIATFQSWNAVLALRSKTILISFGSKVRGVDLPPAFKQSIVTVVGRFPDITFIWKYEEPEDAFAKVSIRSNCHSAQTRRFVQEASASLPNVHFFSWLPQNDLLNDDRVVSFVTHGGIGSSIELALRGKPGIVSRRLIIVNNNTSGIFVPIFGDQPRNAGMMEHNGLGKVCRRLIRLNWLKILKVLDKFDLADPDKVEAVIREVITDKRLGYSYFQNFIFVLFIFCYLFWLIVRYAENARRASEMLAKKPYTPSELLIR